MFGTERIGLRAGETSEDEDLIRELTRIESATVPTIDSQSSLMDRLRGEAAAVAHFQARMYRTIAEIAGLEGFDPEGLPAEVTVALRLTRTAGDSEYHLGLLLERFPRVRDLLSMGLIDLRRARVIVEGVANLTDTQANLVLDRVLSVATDLTTGQLSARIRRIKLTMDPEQSRADYMAGLEARRILVKANPDGTANLYALNLAPERVMSIRRRLYHLARQAKTSHDPRTPDQVRADVFVDLLTDRGSRQANEATVDICVDLTTLIGLDESPGHIPGWGPVISEIARNVVFDEPTWSYTVTDQGRPVATGTLRRRPTVGMKRHLRARHLTCGFPGCRMPAGQSDLDHTQPRARGGPTSVQNLVPFCRYHHRLKDHGWSYGIETDDTTMWTSPLGNHYATGADPPV